MDARSVLIEARGDAGISQRELARRSGVPQAAISRIERGLVSPRVDTLDRLLHVCGRDVETVERPGAGLDRTLIRERLRITTAERARLAVADWVGTRPFRQGRARMSEPSFDPFLALRMLVDHGLHFVLIGGYAACLRGSPVITGGLDACHAADGENLTRLTEALGSLDASLEGASPDVAFRLDARMLRAGDHFTFSTSAGPLDILGTPAGTTGFRDLDANATDEVIDGLTIRVASIEDLIRMKRAAGRPKDRIALEWLSAARDEAALPSEV